MCCQPGMAHGHAADDCGCGCGRPHRRFLTAQEEQERLEAYSDQLQKELTAVGERIKRLKTS